MEKYILHKNVFQYNTIDATEIPFSQSVVDACRANACGRYATSWTCPPGVGDIKELESKIKSYKKALVFSCKYDLEDSFDFEGMMEGAKTTQELLFEILDDMKADGVDYMALGCEGCILCKECTYPDAPCRFPDKATPSIEACGISVVELSKKLNINYHNGPNTVTFFCTILTR